jgi:hypothetical protein
MHPVVCPLAIDRLGKPAIHGFLLTSASWFQIRGLPSMCGMIFKRKFGASRLASADGQEVLGPVGADGNIATARARRPVWDARFDVSEAMGGRS